MEQSVRAYDKYSLELRKQLICEVDPEVDGRHACFWEEKMCFEEDPDRDYERPA